MKKYFFGLLLVFIVNNVLANTLDTYITINRFFQIESQKDYVEISFLVPASLVEYKLNSNNKFQAKLKVNLSINRGDETISRKVYILQTNEFANLNDIQTNLKDVIRLFAPTGDTLNLKINIEDVNNAESYYKTDVDLFISKHKDVFLSDIMLISSANKSKQKSPFNRNNILVIPKFLNYYPTEISKINFYCEFYQLNTQEDYLVRYLLTNEEGVFVDGYASYKRIEKKNYDVIISGFDISKLPSGNYYLYMELKDKKNNIVEVKRTFFQRNNKSENVVENINTQKNELDVIVNNFAKKYDLVNIRHHCMALAPISNSFERATLESFKNSDDLELMQNYFFSFWKERNKSDPEAEWMVYAKKLQFVERNFTTMSHRGYETSRGIVYLMYGPPDDTRLYRKNTEFWLWNYDELLGQGNVYFVFVNRDNITDDFVLEHTTLKGQLYNKKWAEFIKNEL